MFKGFVCWDWAAGWNSGCWLSRLIIVCPDKSLPPVRFISITFPWLLRMGIPGSYGELGLGILPGVPDDRLPAALFTDLGVRYA